jgi:oligoendopeptidase F
MLLRMIQQGNIPQYHPQYERNYDGMTTSTPTAELVTGAENILWDLSVMYQGVDDPTIQTDMDWITTQADAFAAAYRGKIAQLDAAGLLQAVQTLENIHDRLSKIGIFGNLLFSTDSASAEYGALVQKATEFGAAIEQKLTFFELEWNDVPDERAAQVIHDPLVAYYRHMLEAQRRYKPHQLTEPEELILTEKSVTGRSAWVRFFGQLTSALRPEFEGQKTNLTMVLRALYEPDRALRQRAAQSVTAALADKSMELTYIFNVVSADKASDDKLRSYPSWVSARNLANKAPDAVVEALIQAVTARYDLVARHYDLKRKLLKLDALADYDRYAPLGLKESSAFYTWDQARSIVLTAFQTFSHRFHDIANRFFTENWIHAPVLSNKRHGAFCMPGANSVHPYVLMNYTGKARDVQTLAHELGHGIHSYLSLESHGLFGLHTPLTTAEMASTFAEMLVFSDLMQKETDDEARLGMLAGKIEDTFATVFRQISMNRFEDSLHTARRTEGELSTDRINELWLKSQNDMFGSSVTMTEDYGRWWGYVGHFVHTPGYVYAYSFGELLVLALFQLYQQRGAAFVPQFEAVLAAGDSDWPERILGQVGIDLTDLNFWKQGLAAIEQLVAQEEALAKQLYPDLF